MAKKTPYEVFCNRCGTVGLCKYIRPGNTIVEVILYFFYLLPGFMYTTYRNHKQYTACAVCESADVIGANTPVGKKLIKEQSEGE